MDIEEIYVAVRNKIKEFKEELEEMLRKADNEMTADEYNAFEIEIYKLMEDFWSV